MGHHHPQVEGGPRGHRLRAARGDPGLGAAKEVEAGRFGWISRQLTHPKARKNGETSVKNQVSVLLSPDCQRFNAQLIRSLVPETPFKTQEKAEQKQETTSKHQRRNTRKHQEKTSKQIKQQPRKTRKNSQNPGKTKQTTRTALGF